LNHSSVLIVSDDTEFARSLAARWHAERSAPEITLATSDVWHAGSAAHHHLIIVGPVRTAHLARIFSTVASASAAAVCVAGEREISQIRAEYPSVLAIPRRDSWIDTLILVAGEALRRIDAVHRAQRAERMAREGLCDATLGRYMLEMRPSINNALTSVLGNADLLLLEPGGAAVSPELREQIQTIHTMALRLMETMQRFSSLASEMRAGEKESQAETEEVSHGL
jgi:signal transduction histidine kinase